MSALPTRVEKEAGQNAHAAEIFEITAAREIEALPAADALHQHRTACSCCFRVPSWEFGT